MEVFLNYYKTIECLIDSDEAYGYTEHETDYSHIDLSLVKNGHDYDSLHISDTLRGKQVNFCYAIYSSGSSFSSHKAEFIELLFVCESTTDANNAYAALSKAKSTVTVSLDGKDIPIHIPWNGYFESLDKLELETTVLK